MKKEDCAFAQSFLLYRENLSAVKKTALQFYTAYCFFSFLNTNTLLKT